MLLEKVETSISLGGATARTLESIKFIVDGPNDEDTVIVEMRVPLGHGHVKIIVDRPESHYAEGVNIIKVEDSLVLSDEDVIVAVMMRVPLGCGYSKTVIGGPELGRKGLESC